jgi:transcription factor IIIB 90 kDa subunit
LEQFQTIDFEAEADPPIYTKNKIREARAKAIQEGNVQLLTSGILDDDGKRGSRWRTTKPKNTSERSIKFQELYQTLDKKLNDVEPSEIVLKGTEDSPEQATTIDGTTTESQIVIHDNQLVGDEQSASALTQWNNAYPKSRGRNMIMPNEATVEEQLPSSAPTEAKLNLSEWKQHLPNNIDLEIDDFFRSNDEMKQKEAIFNKINKDYIIQQERKENERLDIEAATKDQDMDDMIQAANQARYNAVRNNTAHGNITNKQKRQQQQQREGDAANNNNNSTSAVYPMNTITTTEEQLRAAVSSRKVSRKINYDALSSIFDDDGSFATTITNVNYDDDDDDDNDAQDMENDEFNV